MDRGRDGVPLISHNRLDIAMPGSTCRWTRPDRPPARRDFDSLPASIRPSAEDKNGGCKKQDQDAGSSG
jgi:hypothetical protein